MEADRKLSNDELPVICIDVYDAQHDKIDAHVSLSIGS